jgi:MFS family permease
MKRDWWVVVACLMCQIGMGVGGYIFPVFLKPVTAELGWSRTAYASANPIMSTVVAVAGSLIGWLAVRIGPRYVLLTGGILMGGALIAAGAMQSLLHWYVIAIFIGIAVACLGDLPTGAAIAGRFEQQRGLALGLVYIGSNIGGGLIPLVATLVASTSSWRDAFRIVGIAVTVAVLPFAALVPPVRAQAEERATTRPMGMALRQLDFWLLFWVVFAFYFYRLGVNVHLVAYMTDLGYSEEQAATGFSLTLTLGIAGKLLAGSLADRIGAKIAVLTNFVLLALASILLLLPDVPGALPAFLIVHGATTAAEDVVVPLIVGQRFGMENLSRVYGLLLLALVPGGTLGPLLAGRIFDLSGSYTGVFSLFVVCNVLAVLALVAVIRR